MPLLEKSRLGPYEIKSLIGAGGMGEVYRARDSRLHRDVAIKILQSDTGTTAERSRFEREARALAALNHPNIVAVHDFGIQDDQPYIVSELIEGNSLCSFIGGKAVSPRKLVDIAAEIADGLAAAHAVGILHRDLKPENIMITRDGHAKIVDFGLARHATSSGAEETASLDAVQRVTEKGAVMGTAAYMSPEQALGKTLDHRSDQFSFGLILYEMGSGRRAFRRQSSVETMAAIVRDDPEPIEEKLPAPLQWIIDRCLAKEPEQRYESTRDLYHDLRSLHDHFSQAWTSRSGIETIQSHAPRRYRYWMIGVLAGAGCLLLGGALGWVMRRPGQLVGNLSYTPFANSAYSPVWSPEGKAVAYTGSVNHRHEAFLRYIGSPVQVQLTRAPDDATVVGWSADRRHLIVFVPENGDKGRIASVATVGSDLQSLMDVPASSFCSACDVSPDGKTFAALSRPSPQAPWSVYISDPIGSPLRPYEPAPFASRSVDNVPQLRFSPNGKAILLIFTGDQKKTTAWLLPLQERKQAHQVLLKLPQAGGTASFSWFPDNRHIAISIATEQSSRAHLWIADTQSDKLEQLTNGTTEDYFPALSPDGKSLVFTQNSTNFDVRSVSLSDGLASTLESTGRSETMPAWSSGTNELAWVSDRSGPFEIWLRSGDGSERPVVTSAQFTESPTQWFMNPALSPDGKTLVFVRIARNGPGRLWIMSLTGGVPVRLTSVEPDDESGGAFSPDGKEFAYLQESKGEDQLVIARTNADTVPITVARAQNTNSFLPDWSPDGKWITWHDDSGWHLVSRMESKRGSWETSRHRTSRFRKMGNPCTGSKPRQPGKT